MFLKDHLYCMNNTGYLANNVIGSQRAHKRITGEGLRNSKHKAVKVPRKLIAASGNTHDPDDVDPVDFSQDVSCLSISTYDSIRIKRTYLNFEILFCKF